MKVKIEKACDHIGIFTNDSKKLEDFYIKALGFKKEKESILSKQIVKSIFGTSSDCKFIKLVSGNMMIEIFEPISSRLRKKFNNIVGLNHWGYCVGDRKKFVKKLRQKKVNIIEIKRNDHIIYFITDPDGNRIEIREDKK
ncbi:VOC family protein [candidate division WOR-3 bacterium]|nr:VOC family protein [candidate division WOR-3 bacterium]